MTEIRSLPERTVESYVTRKELARIMAISLSTVDRLTRAGMPSVTWGRARRYRPEIAMQWAREHGGDLTPCA